MSMTSLSRRDVVPILVICLLFGVAGALLLNEMSFSTDSIRYIIWGTSLSQGNGLVDYTVPVPTAFAPNAPLYAFMLAPLLLLFPYSMLAAKIFTLCIGIGALALFFVWLRGHIGLSLTIAGTLFLGANSFFLILSTSALSEIPFIAAVLAVFLLIERTDAERAGSRYDWMLIGIVSLIALLREIGIALVAACLIYYLFRSRRKQFLILLVAAAAFLVLWYLRNTVFVSESLRPDEASKIPILFTNYVTSPGTPLLHEYVTRLWLNVKGYLLNIGGLAFYPFPAFLLVQPSEMLGEVIRSITATKFVVLFIAGSLCVHGIVVDTKSSAASLVRILFLLFSTLILLLYPVYDPRFLLPILPVVLYYALLSIRWWWSELVETDSLIPRLAALLFSGIIILPNALSAIEIIGTNREYLRDPSEFAARVRTLKPIPDYYTQPWHLLGKWINERLPEKTILAAPAKDISIFVNDRPVLELSRAIPTPHFERMLRDNRVEYLIARVLWDTYETYEFQMSESSRFWFEPVIEIAGLRMYRVHSQILDPDSRRDVQAKSASTETAVGLLRRGRHGLLNLNDLEMVGALQLASQMEPRQVEIRFQLLVAYCAIGDAQNAIQTYQILYSTPNADPYLTLAPAFLNAMQSLRVAAETENAEERFHLALRAARIYGDMGLPNQAIRVLEYILEADSSYFDAHLWAWYYSRQTGDTLRSASHLERLQKIDNEAPILAALIGIHRSDQMLGKARSSAEQVESRLSLAHLYTQLELIEDALDQVEYALHDEPGNIRAWRLLRLLFAEKDAKVALEFAESMLRRLDPLASLESN